MFKRIIRQFNGPIVQFNKDGEPLLYDELYSIGMVTKEFFTNIVTNGILLAERADALINKFDSVTVSVIEDDHEQKESVKAFLKAKGTRLPQVFIKFLGDYHDPEYSEMGLKTLRRTLHNPQGDWDYQNRQELIPEIGICQDLLMKPAIDWRGNVHICNRFDPEGKGIIGNVENASLKSILTGKQRRRYIDLHRLGRRSEVSLCEKCQFWGIPRYV